MSDPVCKGFVKPCSTCWYVWIKIEKNWSLSYSGSLPFREIKFLILKIHFVKEKISEYEVLLKHDLQFGCFLVILTNCSKVSYTL